MWCGLFSICNGVNIHFICYYVITFPASSPPPPQSNCTFIKKCHFSILLLIDIPVSPWVPYSIEFAHCWFTKYANLEKCILHIEWEFAILAVKFEVFIFHVFTGNSHHPWSHAWVVISKSTVMHQFVLYVRLNHVVETPRNQRRKTEIFWAQMEKVYVNDTCF